jgi:hypothetical protein
MDCAEQVAAIVHGAPIDAPKAEDSSRIDEGGEGCTHVLDLSSLCTSTMLVCTAGKLLDQFLLALAPAEPIAVRVHETGIRIAETAQRHTRSQAHQVERGEQSSIDHFLGGENDGDDLSQNRHPAS